MFVRANFVDIYSQAMRDRSMQSGTELAREIKVTDWSMARNLSNRSSGVQIPRDICTRLKRYLHSAKCSWIITADSVSPRMNTIASRDQFNPILIGENLVTNYYLGYSSVLAGRDSLT